MLQFLKLAMVIVNVMRRFFFCQKQQEEYIGLLDFRERARLQSARRCMKNCARPKATSLYMEEPKTPDLVVNNDGSESAEDIVERILSKSNEGDVKQ